MPNQNETDLFNEETPRTLSDFMGQGKKYSDEAAVAKALQEKDLFIEKLKSENNGLRVDLTSRASLEDLLTAANTQKPEEPQQLVPQQPAPSDPTDSPNIEEEVLKLLRQEKAKDSRDVNIKTVRDALTTKFGENYNSTLERVATALSVSKSFLADMAATSPSGLLKLVESVVPPGDPTITPPTSAVETGRIVPNSGLRNKAYFDNIRKTDLKTYLSKKVQSEMYKEAMRQGNDFFIQ